MSVAKSRSRPKEVRAEEEQALWELKLGDMQNAPTLSMSETAVLIDAVKGARLKSGKPLKQTDVLNRVENYLDIFARFKRKENVEAVGRLLEDTPLEKWERSQLATLCCEAAIEAKALVPSIGDKMTNEDLRNVLQQINQLRGAE